MKTSKLTRDELIEYARISRKTKPEYVGIKLSKDEYERYKFLAEKNGQPVSTMLRETLFSNLYHFKGIKTHKK